MRDHAPLRSPVVFLLLLSVWTGAETSAAPPQISKTQFADTSNTLLPAGPGAYNLETSSAVVPPGADMANCKDGRLFVSHARRWMTRVDLAPAGVAISTQDVFNLDTLIQRGNMLASRLVNGRCEVDPANPQFEFNGGGDDTHVIRVGPKPGSLIVAFTGSHSVSVPAGSPPLAADLSIDPKTIVAKAGSCSWTRNNVNFIARTDDCGKTWQKATVAIDNGPADAVKGPFTNGCGNLDQTMLHRDPFSAGHELYAFGGTGPNCTGGVNASALYWSGDQGASWKRVFLFSDFDLYTPSLTTTPSGILAVFGCNRSGKAVLAYSYSRGLSFESQELGVPCEVVPSEEMSVCSNSPTATSISFAKTSEDGTYDIVRLLYPIVVKPATSLEDPKQAYRMEFANLRRKAVPGAPMTFSGGENLMPANAASNILRASFIDPDGFGVPGTPRSTLLWWQEAPGSPQFRTYYQVLTGVSTRSETYPLSIKGGASDSFSARFALSGGCRFAGDYDRGSFFQAAGGNPRYLTQWSQSHHGDNIVVGDAIVHFNTVEVRQPKFTGWRAVGGSSELTSSPVAVAPLPGKIEVFFRATDGSLQSLRKTGSAWESTPRKWGGPIRNAPAVAARADGRIDVFALDTNDHMRHLVIKDTVIETDWHDLGGGEFQGQPAAASTGEGKVTVFGLRKSDGQVLALTWNQGWGPWIPVAQGKGAGGVGAVSWGPDRIDVFVRGLNGRLWHYGSDQGTAAFPGEWEDLGGNAFPLFAPAVATDGAGKLHVFIAHGDLDQSIAYRRYDGGWGDWVDAGGSTAMGPSAALSSVIGQRLRAYVRGRNGRLWENGLWD